MNPSELQAVEVDLLLEAMFRRYGYDFRSYARASIERRLRHFLVMSGEKRISDLIPKALHDEDFFSDLAQTLSVPTTEMFRDPAVFRVLREEILPVLRTWPHFKIWHAGCATGEEVYSLAIILREEGLEDRATIYATDFNDAVLAKAKDGIYDLERIKRYTEVYQASGGKRSFSSYYHARYGSAVMDSSLRARITFANHNLALDRVFGEMHLVMCRNVLIYFNQDLQNRALNLFSESLVNGGFLCLGTKEALRFSDIVRDFREVEPGTRIYKKTGGSGWPVLGERS